MANENPKADLLVSEEMLNTYHTGAVLPIKNNVAAIGNVLGAKNFIPTKFDTQVSSGVTYTYNSSDRTVTLSGLKNGTANVTITDRFIVPKGEYILSNEGANSSQIALRFRDPNLGVNIDIRGTNTATITVSADTEYVVLLFIDGANTTISATCKPMLRPAAIVDATYVPYAETNAQLTADKEKLDAYNYAMGKEYGITYASLPHTFSVPEGTGGRLLVSGRDSYISIFYLSRISNSTQVIKNDQNFVVSHNGTSFTVSSVGTIAGGSGTTFKLIGAPFTVQV